MNAPRSFIRATMAPASLAAAIGMAVAMSAPALAQYSYPGTASSSGHYASSIHPIRAGARADRANTPARLGPRDPGTRVGEDCPPGSNCGIPTSGSQQSNGGGPAPSTGYGGQARYGYGRAADAERPAQAGGNASISPVRAGAGRGAFNYGPSQASNSNFNNTVRGKSTGPSTNVGGQRNSFSGPNGTVNMGNSAVVGPNGQKLGQQNPNGTIGHGYGQQKGSGINNGYSYSSQNGSMNGSRTGSAPGMASANGMNMNNGGAAGAEEGDRTNPNFKSGQHGKNAVYDGVGTNTWFDPKDPQGGGHPENGNDRNGTQWVDNMVWDGTDSNGTEWRNGKWDGNGPPPSMDETNARAAAAAKGDDKKGGKGGEMPADMGPTSGPGEVVSGTGQVVHPGSPGGSDVGGGQGKDSGGSSSGSNKNATGQYATSNTPLAGQDAPLKPKEQGTLKVNYNGKLGVTDPQTTGGH